MLRASPDSPGAVSEDTMYHYRFSAAGLTRNGADLSQNAVGLIIQVNTSLPKGTKLRMTPFRSGTNGTARRLSTDIDTDFFEFPEGAYLNVFFPDGSVTRLHRPIGSKEVDLAKLSCEAMAVERINWCINGLNERKLMSSGGKNRLEDAVLYQLELIYRFGSKSVRERVMKLVYALVEKKTIGIRNKPIENLLGTLYRENLIDYHGLRNILPG